MNPAAPPLAGVLGQPIAQSLSPKLHGHWLARYGIAGYYVPLEVAPADLAPALDLLPRLGFLGANVTLPHKETVLGLAAAVSKAAEAIGAANTLGFRPGGGFEADNTDAIGFLRNLRQGAPDWRAESGPALVLGAGGAARAVAWALRGAGVPEVRIANRSPERAARLCAHLGARVVPVAWTDVGAGLADAATLVNTTSLGMTDQPGLDLDLALASAHLVVCDVVYRPLETRLLRTARARGLTAVDGLGMLLHQAVPGFERWFGRRPEVDAAVREAVLAR